jgi:predicted RNase H-like HicB family nuclease
MLSESMRNWEVILEWDEEGLAWVTSVPTLNGISTFGSTREEVLGRTQEAIRGYLRAAAKRRICIP